MRPPVGWNPECSWADFLPDIFKEAGTEALVMDGAPLLLSFDDVRRATGLSFDVRGHSNKNKLFKIEDYIADKEQYLRYLTNYSTAPNGLKLIFRSDFMGNPMLWYLMGATEGNRKTPVELEEIDAMLKRWSARIEATGNFILPYAEGEQIEESLQDADDRRTLRTARRKDRGQPSIPLAEVKKHLGL